MSDVNIILYTEPSIRKNHVVLSTVLYMDVCDIRKIMKDIFHRAFNMSARQA